MTYIDDILKRQSYCIVCGKKLPLLMGFRRKICSRKCQLIRWKQFDKIKKDKRVDKGERLI